MDVSEIVLTVIGILLAVTAVYFIACYIGFYMLVVSPPRFDLNKPNALMGPDFPAMVDRLHADLKKLSQYPSEPVTVVTDDGLKLFGTFYPNPDGAKITIVCLHGYSSSGRGDFGSRALGYLQSGYNVLLANHRHHAKSEGKYIGFGVLDRKDVRLWLEAANARIPNGEIFISGVSMGGATAMQASCLPMPENVKGIIEDCGYTSVKKEFEFQCRRVVRFVPRLTLKVIDFYMRKIAGYGIDEVNSVDCVKNANIPIMFIHGDSDNFVPTEMVYRVYEACRSEKELYVVPGAAHAMAEFKNPAEYYDRVNAFIYKYSDLLKKTK